MQRETYRYAYQVVPESTLEDGRPWYPLGLGITPTLRARLNRAKDQRDWYRKHKYGILEVTPETIRTALALIENGRPYIEHWYDDGDAESGPMGGTYVGYRWGQMRLVVHRNGSVSLQRTHTKSGIYMTRTVYDSTLVGRSGWYTGLPAMIRDHMKALRDNVERNGVEFAITGKRAAIKA